MKTDLLGQEKNVVTIKVEYEASEFVKFFNKTLNKFTNDINIKGFRKGHAPRRIIEMQVGKERLLSEALTSLLDSSLSEVINEYELNVIAQPMLDNVSKLKEGEPVSCELKFEIVPEVKLPDFGEISIERVRVNVTDDMVNELIMQIRMNSAETYKVGTGEGEQDRGINPDDIVRVEIKSRVLEEEDNDYPPQVHVLDLAAQETRPEIRDALVGHKVNDDVTVIFTTEENYPQKEIAGKQIHYAMKVQEITGRNLSELNEEFFKKFFGEDTEILTEDAFKAWCRNKLTENMNDQHDLDAAGRAMTEISNRAELEVPDSMVNRNVASMREHDENEAKERYSMDLKTFLGGADDPDWEKNYLEILRSRARNALRHLLIMNEIAKENNIKVEKEDLAKWAQSYAMTYHIDPNFVIAQLSQNNDTLNNAVEDVRNEKILRFVLSKVNVHDVDQLSKPESTMDNAN